MPTGADSNIVLEQAGADPGRLRILQKLHIAAGLMTALNWIAALAVVFRRLPSLDGLYDRLSIPLVLTFVWFVSNSSDLRGHKWAKATLVLVIIAGLFWATGTVIELR